MKKTSDIKRALRRKHREPPITPKDLLSTGSTLLNIACSGRARGGFPKGKFVYLVGDSTSGKTFLSLTCLAEASINPVFKDYRFIFDDVEGGALMDIERFFGAKVAERIEAPDHGNSGNIEEFYFNLDDAVAAGQPFIYILDSMDALDSQDDADKFRERKQAYRKGKEVSGSYGMSKAKHNSTDLRKVVSDLGKTGSILIVISQTRDNIQQFSKEKKTRAGGRALRFYATLEVWSSVREHITKTVKGKSRELGILCQVKVKKNRVNGRNRTVEFPIYHSHGIDDVGGCVDYLLEEGYWKKGANGIVAEEWGITLPREQLIKHIEEGSLEVDLQGIVADCWNEIEAACAVKRKSRYG